MSTVELTAENFQQVIDENDTVFVDFWAEWCGPCRTFAPVFEQAAQKYPDMVFGKVDTEAQQELAAAFGIQSIPTLMAFREKVLLYAQPGALPSEALESLVKQVQELDMDDVHKQVAEQQAQHAHEGHDHDHGHAHDH